MESTSTRNSVKEPWLFTLTPPTIDPANEIYNIYPKKVGRPYALKAIRRALKQFGFDHVVNRTKAYREAVQSINPQFIPYPATWFNQERFNDDPTTWVLIHKQLVSQPKFIDRRLDNELQEAENIYARFQ